MCDKILQLFYHKIILYRFILVIINQKNEKSSEELFFQRSQRYIRQATIPNAIRQLRK